MFKKITAILAIFSMVFLTAGCYAQAVINPIGENDVIKTVEKLNSAKEIRAKKKIFTMGDSWEIFADNEKVGNVNGKVIYAIGDTYSFTTNNGYFVGAEQENFSIVQRTAGIFNENNEKIGEIKQKVFSWLMQFTLYKNGQVNASVEQNFSFNLNADIKNGNGEVNWKVNKKMLSWSADLSIVREGSNNSVEALDALWLALILNEIDEANNNSETGNN